MGDYTKFIVNADVRKFETEKEVTAFENEIRERLEPGCSAYHCGGELLVLDNDTFSACSVTIVSQQKYSSNIDEFLEWFTPLTIQGMGEDECIALAFTEYNREPRCYYGQYTRY